MQCWNPIQALVQLSPNTCGKVVEEGPRAWARYSQGRPRRSSWLPGWPSLPTGRRNISFCLPFKQSNLWGKKKKKDNGHKPHQSAQAQITRFLPLAGGPWIEFPPYPASVSTREINQLMETACLPHESNINDFQRQTALVPLRHETLRRK